MLSKIRKVLRYPPPLSNAPPTQQPNVTNPPFCPNVGEWAVRSGYSSLVLYPEKTVQYVPPETIEEKVDSTFTSMYKRNIPAKYLAVIPKAEILGWRGVIRLPDGSFPSEVVL